MLGDNKMLSFAQPGEQHDLPVGKLQRVVMHVGLFQVDLPEPCHLLTDQFLAPEDLKNTLTFDFRLECDLGAGKKHTATVGSSTAAKPPVREFLNFVVTSFSPIFAGRDATKSRL